VRTLVVDDEDDMRVLLSAVIRAANDGLEVVGEARDGFEAVERCREHQPDVIVLDQRMPGMTGVETAPRLLEEKRDVRVILFSAFLDEESVASAMANGVSKCLPKSDLPGLIEALRGN
jgi:DNA-binding NarL/FixJ family response regulator